MNTKGVYIFGTLSVSYVTTFPTFGLFMLTR
jgi:hypothetical protein